MGQFAGAIHVNTTVTPDVAARIEAVALPSEPSLARALRSLAMEGLAAREAKLAAQKPRAVK